MTKRPILLAWGGLTLFIVLALAGEITFTQQEKARALLAWQDNLGLVADSRDEAVNDWLRRQFSVLRELTDNTSLQLYLAQISLSDGKDEELPEAVYLRDLLTLAGHRSGFILESPTDALQVNQEIRGEAGIALLDNNGRVLVSTAGMPQLNAKARTTIAQVMETGEAAIVDLYAKAGAAPAMGFAMPILAVQSSPGDRPVGIAIGIKPVSAELFPLLRQKGLTSKTRETYLVAARNGNVVYLSPLHDGTKPLTRRLGLNNPRLAASVALDSPGLFAKRDDYRGVPVLFTSRKVEHTPWVLVHKIDAEEALREANERQATLLGVLLLVVTAVAVSLVAAWKHGSSVRFRETAETLAANNAELEAQRRLLRSVTDNVDDLIFILETDMSLRFANAALAKAHSVSPDDIVGKSLASLFGAYIANELQERLSKSDDDDFRFSDTLTVSEQERHFHVSVSRLVDGATLLVMHDVTELLAAQERSQRMLYQLVQTLAGILDRHDPYTAHHSRKVSTVSLAVAERLGFDQAQLDSLRIAANLMNLGKITIPPEVLTKTGKLSDEEFELIRGHVNQAVKMLEGVEFDGPVIESIAQSHECIDGSGYPNRLRGDQISMPAKILGVCNAFVAITNPRSFRSPRSFQEAVDILMADAAKKYSRKVIAALFTVVEDEQTGKRWEREWQAEANS